MRTFAVFLLLIVGSVRGSSDNEAASCHNEFQAKMSSTSTLRYSLKLAKKEIKELHVSLNETQDMQEAAKRKEIQLERALMSKQELVEALEPLVQNFTMEVQELHSTCDRALPIDCCQIKTVLPVVNNGLYEIKDPCSGNNIFNFAKISVRCDMETDGGGWIVIQQRNASLGTVNFTRNWEDYVNGFGDLDGEFWIGLNNIYQLTNQQNVELQFSVWNDKESAITWNYQTFRITDSASKYRLTAGGGTGDGNYDALAYNNGNYFTTYDRDNSARGYNCGYKDQGGWWYNHCTNVNLNGRHERSGLPGTHSTEQLLIHYSSGRQRVYTNSIMMIRSKTCGLSG